MHIPGRGELFVRDTGGDGPLVLLLHGWVVSADLNWLQTYEPLAAAGYRAVALDHRGHGRGLRTYAPFRLADCAADAAALVEQLDAGPAWAVGYSMGGPIAQFMARDHPATICGLVLGATSSEWRSPRMRVTWRLMGLTRLTLGLFPQGAWRAGLRRLGLPDSPATTWVAAELTRGSSIDLAEAGRELGRFDSRAWVGSLGVPAAVIVTVDDMDVPADRQRELATRLGARVYELEGGHVAVSTEAGEFNRLLLEALSALGGAAETSPPPTASPTAP